MAAALPVQLVVLEHVVERRVFFVVDKERLLGSLHLLSVLCRVVDLLDLVDGLARRKGQDLSIVLEGSVGADAQLRIEHVGGVLLRLVNF